MSFAELVKTTTFNTTLEPSSFAPRRKSSVSERQVQTSMTKTAIQLNPDLSLNSPPRERQNVQDQLSRRFTESSIQQQQQRDREQRESLQQQKEQLQIPKPKLTSSFVNDQNTFDQIIQEGKVSQKQISQVNQMASSVELLNTKQFLSASQLNQIKRNYEMQVGQLNQLLEFERLKCAQQQQDVQNLRQQNLELSQALMKQQKDYLELQNQIQTDVITTDEQFREISSLKQLNADLKQQAQMYQEKMGSFQARMLNAESSVKRLIEVLEEQGLTQVRGGISQEGKQTKQICCQFCGKTDCHHGRRSSGSIQKDPASNLLKNLKRDEAETQEDLNNILSAAYRNPEKLATELSQVQKLVRQVKTKKKIVKEVEAFQKKKVFK
ncbi:Hypothetical_protein [Hexamita inflata]|uniref:Hypothetical_protein n=1 Tax=Hexamita inflata TaxID=28002 RepID=A0ABP1HR99_9EUKA